MNGLALTTNPLRSASLCMGIGGLDLAAEAVFGCELAWYSEIEPAACTVVERTWDAPNVGDLTVADWASLEPVDVLTAGYPCQPFSHAGKRKGSADVRHLWPYVCGAVRALRPRWVLLENVRGHLSLGFDRVLGDLADAGFDAEWCVLRASDVGACHQRARLFILAADASGERHGRRQDGGAVGAMDPGHAGAPRQRERARQEPGDRGADAPDSYSVVGATRGTLAGRPGTLDEPGTLERTERLHCVATAEPDSGRLEERAQLDGEPLEDSTDRCSRGRHADGLGHVAWGPYEPAIRRWERTLGRAAPRPVDDQGRLSPSFVCWMQGYPEGWVDGLTRTAALKALGNAVVPLQGATACRLLLDAYEGAA